jgi:hypothetical protein
MQIPIDLLSPHPKLATRLRLEVGSLAAIIREAVDEDVPNGQLEPGRVVPREHGDGYHVYIGVRRFYALKSLHEETGEERFAVFNAYVDSKEKPLLDLFLRVRSENEEGKGERVGLSVLEKVFGLRKISGSVSHEKLGDGLRRELAVAEKLDERRIMKLFEVERATRFGYRLEHLERLCQIGDTEGFFESAACIAGFAFPPERMEKAVEGREAARMLKWFGSLFPEYAKGTVERPAAERRAPSQQETDASEEIQKKGPGANAPDLGLLEIHEKEVIIVPCPACGVENMVQLRLEAEVTRLSDDPTGESVTAVPDAVVNCGLECCRCHGKFHVFIRPLGGRRHAVDASLSPEFREPREEVEAVDLRFDFQNEAWQKIAGERIVGVVRTRGRAKK